MNFKDFFKDIGHFFSSPRGRLVLLRIEQIAVDAGPIVTTIAKLTPNGTFVEVAAAYNQYGVPLLLKAEMLSEPSEPGVAQRDLAVKVLQGLHPDASVQHLNTGVELAVAAHDADIAEENGDD